MNAVAQVPARDAREVRVVNDPVPILDTAKFEHMQRIAVVMASSSLIPEGLSHEKVDKKLIRLPDNVVVANCFLVVNQATRWNMDPFAVAQCASVVHGRLMFEGKLVHAVIEARLGVRLNYIFDGAKGDNLGVKVVATLPGEATPRDIEGTVADWRTTGDNSPWSRQSAWKRQLRYRGAREWARAHAPGVMLGVITDDEIEDLVDNARASRARDLTPPAPSLPKTTFTALNSGDGVKPIGPKEDRANVDVAEAASADAGGVASSPASSASTKTQETGASPAAPSEGEEKQSSPSAASSPSTHKDVVTPFIKRCEKAAKKDGPEAYAELAELADHLDQEIGKNVSDKEHERANEGYVNAVKKVNKVILKQFEEDLSQAVNIEAAERIRDEFFELYGELISRNVREFAINSYDKGIERFAATTDEPGPSEQAASDARVGEPQTEADYERLFAQMLKDETDLKALKDWWYNTNDFREKTVRSARRKEMRDLIQERFAELRGA